MSELRRDPLLGRWIGIKKTNPYGPNDFEKEDHSFTQEAVCQFCPHREQQTPPEIEAFRPDNSQPNTPGWKTRVVPNKFPALMIEGDLDKRGEGMYDLTNGVGAHEILIETPDHKRDLVDLTIEEIVEVIKKYKSRSLSLARDKRFKYILIFRNYGASAGASVEHAHSQIIALPMVPKNVLDELNGVQNYYGYRGRCVFCDMIDQENQDKERIVVENKDFICFCPFVPRFPFESWILPKEHSTQFCDTSDEQKYSLACTLKEILLRNKICLGNPSYNFYLHNAPVNYDKEVSFHWHIEIIPKLTRVAGFEWGTDFYVVPTPPKVAARYLKEVQIEQIA